MWRRTPHNNKTYLQGLEFGGIELEFVSDTPIQEVIKVSTLFTVIQKSKNSRNNSPFNMG